MTDQLPATHAVPSENAEPDTRHLSIDNSPMRQSNPWDGGRRSVELNQLDADCLVLQPKKWAAFWHLPLILACAAGPIAGLVYMLVEQVRGNPGPMGLLILVLGLLLLTSVVLLSGILAPRACHRWVRFDRRTGLMTISRRPLASLQSLQVVWSRPLTDIICVQLLYAGWQNENSEIGEPGAPGSVITRNYHSYQLNLVVDDREEPRQNLCSHADVKWMREASQRLAAFVRVALIDQLHQGH
jgi:hypothetical protein